MTGRQKILQVLKDIKRDSEINPNKIPNTLIGSTASLNNMMPIKIPKIIFISGNTLIIFVSPSPNLKQYTQRNVAIVQKMYPRMNKKNLFS